MQTPSKLLTKAHQQTTQHSAQGILQRGSGGVSDSDTKERYAALIGGKVV